MDPSKIDVSSSFVRLNTLILAERAYDYLIGPIFRPRSCNLREVCSRYRRITLEFFTIGGILCM